MKKILGIFLMVFALFLTSCGESACVVETTDAEGNKVEVSISKTENPEEVTKAITAIGSSAGTANESIKAVKVSLNANVDFSANSGGEEIKMNGKVSSSMEVNVETMAIYADVDASYNASMKSDTKSETQTGSVKGKVYGDKEYFYVDGTLKNNDNSITIKNKLTTSSIMDMLEGLIGDIQLPEIGNIELPDVSNETVVKTLIEKYNVVISSTSKSTVTFKVDVPLQEIMDSVADSMSLPMDTTITVYAEINAKDAMPKSLRIDASQALDYLVAEAAKADVTIKKPKFSFEMKLDYGDFAVKSLSDAEKENFKEYGTI